MRFNQRFIRILVCSFAVALLVAPAVFAQSTSGNIFGKVVDNQKAALPGVTVTLSGVGASQVFVTDTEGQFRFLGLAPGSYSLQAELSGFGSVVRNNVSVNVGRNSNVELELSPALEQTITVTAETPLLDTRKTGTGATVTQVELEEVPTARDPWVIMAQVPGVLMDRVNVGGNESGQQSGFVSKGSVDQSTFNVDGVNITDMAAQGSSPAYYDFGSFEEIQVSTGGTDPRVQTAGAQINMVTKRGTNELSGSARYYLADGSWQTSPSIPTEAQDYLGKVNEIDRNQEYGLDVGGPIVKDRLWLWGAYAKQNVDLFVAQPVGQDVRFSDKTELETFNYKLNAQITSSNSFVGTWNNNAKTKLGRNASPTRPPETTWNQGQYGAKGVWKIEDTHIFNPNFYMTGMYSEVPGGGFKLIANNGQDCMDFACGTSGDRAAYLDFSPTGDFGWHQSYASLNILRPQKQYHIDGSYFFDTGAANHELKFGFGYRQTKSDTTYGWPQNQLVIWYDGNFGTPAGFGGVEVMRPPGSAPWETKYNDFYAGDTILIGNLTAQVGFRYDNQKSNALDSSAPASPIIPDILPAISLKGSEFGSMKWDDVSPRLGVTYALGQNKKTLLRAAYNRYVDQLGGASGVANNYGFYYSYVYMYFVDQNGDKTAQANELLPGIYGFYNVDPNDTTRATFFNRFDPNVSAPRTDEFIVGAEHEITPEFTVGLTYTHRNLDNFIWQRPEKTQGAGDFFTTADYVMGGTLTGTRPDGTSFAVPYYVLKDGEPASNTWSVVQNRPDYSQTYDGLELTATKRLSNRWMMRGNFSWNDWTQSVGPNAIIDPTQIRSSYGCSVCDGADVVSGSGTGSGAFGGVYINSKWSYVITGLYQIPVIETNLGVNISGRQGYPIPYVAQTAYFGNEGGRKNVLVNDVTAYRHPDIMTLDMRLSKEFRFGGAGLTLSLDAFNVTNEQTVLQRNTLLYRSGAQRPDYNHITEMVSPQIFRVGARITF